jgi:hypothetical protein
VVLPGQLTSLLTLDTFGYGQGQPGLMPVTSLDQLELQVTLGLVLLAIVDSPERVVLQATVVSQESMVPLGTAGSQVSQDTRASAV